jgi:hypothetical protein
MRRIITPSELHRLGYEELRSLFAKVSRELTQTEPGTSEHRTALASLENIRRAMTQRTITACPKPPSL